MDRFVRITTEDAEADVYGIDTDSLMINHASGEHIWQIMIDVARAATMAITPIGCPTCVIDTAMVASLPAASGRVVESCNTCIPVSHCHRRLGAFRT